MSRMRLFAALIAALAGTALSLPGGVFASSPSAHAKKKHCVKYKTVKGKKKCIKYKK
jgi:hypothetical protein